MATGLSQTDIGNYINGIITIPISGVVSMSVATADVPPESLVYGKTVAINDTISYNSSINGLGLGSGTVTVDTLGVPTVTGSYGAYPLPFSFNGGAEETKLVEHKKDTTIEATFSQNLDSEGYQNRVFSATSRLLYVSAAGNDTTAGPSGDSSDFYFVSTIPNVDAPQAPGAVNTYATFAAAYADMREGEDDKILFNRGDSWSPTARLNIGINGKSATERHSIMAYGTGARPKIDMQSMTTFPVFRQTNKNYWEIFDLDFTQEWRDPNHGSFVGYGSTTSDYCIGALATTQNVVGMRVENCVFNYVADGVNTANSTYQYSDIILWRNIFTNVYHESDTIGPTFMYNTSALVEGNLFDYGGWLTDRDATTWPNTNTTGTHTGSNGASILTDGAHTAWTSNMWDQVVIQNTTQSTEGPSTTNTNNTITATGVTWDTGDSYTIQYTRTRGQATNFNHDIYFAKAWNTIIRNNILFRGGSAGIKITNSDDDAVGTVADLIIHDNLIVDCEYGVSIGGNLDNNLGPRFTDVRLMDNFFYKIGFSEHTGQDISQSAWLYDWQDGYVGGNILTKSAAGRALWMGMTCNEHMINTIYARNMFYNLGDASGTSTGVNRGAMVFDASGDVYTNVQFIENDIQMQNTDASIYGDFPSSSDVTFNGQRYDSLAANPYEIDEVAGSYATWLSTTSEVNSSETALTLVGDRTIETYQTSKAATATLDAFIVDAIAMMAPGSWDTSYEAKYIIQYLKDGYTVGTPTIDVVLNASSLSGRSPFVVTFDCSGTTAAGYDEHEVKRLFGYNFDFDDPGSGTYSTTEGGSKNGGNGLFQRTKAFIVADGGGSVNFDVLVNVEAPNGAIGQASVTITVEAQDTAYSAANTICISNTLNTGIESQWTTGHDKTCPAGATYANDFSDISWDAVAGKRIMLHRGQDFTALTQTGNSNAGEIALRYGQDDVLITWFGDTVDTRPEIDMFWLGTASATRSFPYTYTDANFASWGGYSEGITLDGLRIKNIEAPKSFKHFHMHDIDGDYSAEATSGKIKLNTTNAYTASNPLSTNHHHPIGFMMSECTFIGSTTDDAGSNTNLFSATGASIGWGGVVGCYFRWAQEHNFRVMGWQRFNIQNSDFMGDHEQAEKGRITMRGGGHNIVDISDGKTFDTAGQNSTDEDEMPYSYNLTVQWCGTSAGDRGVAEASPWSIMAWMDDLKLTLQDDAYFYANNEITDVDTDVAGGKHLVVAGRYCADIQNKLNGVVDTAALNDAGSSKSLDSIDLGFGTPSLTPNYENVAELPATSNPR